MKNLVDEVEVALPYGTRLFMVIRHPVRVPLRLCAPGTIYAERTTLLCALNLCACTTVSTDLLA